MKKVSLVSAESTTDSSERVTVDIFWSDGFCCDSVFSNKYTHEVGLLVRRCEQSSGFCALEQYHLLKPGVVCLGKQFACRVSECRGRKRFSRVFEGRVGSVYELCLNYIYGV